MFCLKNAHSSDGKPINAHWIENMAKF